MQAKGSNVPIQKGKAKKPEEHNQYSKTRKTYNTLEKSGTHTKELRRNGKA